MAINTHPLYPRWIAIKRRCYGVTAPDYPRYGGRGIKLCERWGRFSAFVEDMEPTFRSGMTLERIDNDGDYSPENCRWATQKEQQRNRNNNIAVDTPWGRMTIAEAAERSGINYFTLWTRHQSGTPLFRPLATGNHAGRRPLLFFDTPWGKMTRKEAAQKSGVSPQALYWRYRNGKPLF